MNGWHIAWQFARRELRGGVRGFRVLIACLALGVASVAGVGSVATALKVGLKAEGRVLLGGDVDLVFTHRQASKEQLGWLRENTAAFNGNELRTMARRLDGGKQRLVELKGVDVSYPLYGGLILRDGADLSAALQKEDGRWGAVVDPRVLQHLDLTPGGTFKIGGAEFVVTAILDREPDRGTQAFRLGPRVIVSKAATVATRLIQPGSLIRYQYRLALPPEEVLGEWRAKLDERFPGGWRIRDVGARNTAVCRPRGTIFIPAGLTALLVGGVGVANAVRSFMDSRVRSIATLKCLGATSAIIFRTYALQVGLMASTGITIGLIAGVLTPVAVSPLLEGRLPVTAEFGFYPVPLFTAAAFGFLVAAIFTLWPLGLAGEVRATSLFRSNAERLSGRPPRQVYIALVVLSLLIGAIAIVTAVRPDMAAWYILGATLVFGIFRLTGAVIVAGLRRLPRIRQPLIRLAFSNLHRPGAPTTAALLSLGLGLTVLVAVALLEHNLERQIQQVLPEEAPGYYFIDIQPTQTRALDELLSKHPGVGAVQRVPMLRGRITKMNGTPVEEITPPPDFAWIRAGTAAHLGAQTTVRGQPNYRRRMVAGRLFGRTASLLRCAGGQGIRIGDRRYVDGERPW